MRTYRCNAKKYEISEHLKLLAMPKQEHVARNIFDHTDFRGLLIADHTKVLGPIIENLHKNINDETDQALDTLRSFRESKIQRSTMKEFYRSQN